MFEEGQEEEEVRQENEHIERGSYEATDKIDQEKKNPPKLEPEDCNESHQNNAQDMGERNPIEEEPEYSSMGIDDVSNINHNFVEPPKRYTDASIETIKDEGTTCEEQNLFQSLQSEGKSPSSPKSEDLEEPINTDDSVKLRSVWFEGDEKKTLCSGSEDNDGDDIPTPTCAHARGDCFKGFMFEDPFELRIRVLDLQGNFKEIWGHGSEALVKLRKICIYIGVGWHPKIIGKPVHLKGLLLESYSVADLSEEILKHQSFCPKGVKQRFPLVEQCTGQIAKCSSVHFLRIGGHLAYFEGITTGSNWCVQAVKDSLNNKEGVGTRCNDVVFPPIIAKWFEQCGECLE
eukprot:Gb_21960 [translate_table: standard]